MAGGAPRNGRSAQPDLPGTRPAARPPKPRAAKPRGQARPTGRPTGFGWWDRLPTTARRGIAIGVIVLVLFVGFPVAHALFGEIGALLLLCLIGGFALGRATAPRR